METVSVSLLEIGGAMVFKTIFWQFCFRGDWTIVCSTIVMFFLTTEILHLRVDISEKVAFKLEK